MLSIFDSSKLDNFVLPVFINLFSHFFYEICFWTLVQMQSLFMVYFEIVHFVIRRTVL